MHNLYRNYRRFLKLSKSLLAHVLLEDGNVKTYRNPPQVSDIEVIALSVVAEYLSIPSENQLFAYIQNDYRNQFGPFLSRARFNIRRRKLQVYTAQISQSVANCLPISSTTKVIDSIPIPTCKNPRILRAKGFQDDPDLRPDRGYHAAFKQYYFGYKMQLVILEPGIPVLGYIYPASVSDVQVLEDLKQSQLSDCELIGDKGYISSIQQLSLFEQAKIRVITPLRSNMDAMKSRWNTTFAYIRKRIETLFSQLVSQFHLRTNWSRTLSGLLARITSKLAAVAIGQLINYQQNRPLNQLKHALRF